MEWFDFSELEKVLNDYGQEVRNLYQDKLILHDRIATGGLLNSVEFQVDRNGTKWEVSLSLSEYWKYVEYDTRPHWPPRDAILKWIQAKPILPRPDNFGKIPTPQQLAYLISRKISETGTKGSNDLHDAIDEVNERYRYKIITALAGSADNLYRVLNLRGMLEEKK